jgi:phage terminase large subunit-like protein
LLAGASRTEIEADLAILSDEEIIALAYDWQLWARSDQLAPETARSGEAWRTWLFLGGRGAGKTRAGAEWVRTMALGEGAAPGAMGPARRIALVGPTINHVRSVMIEGVSGLMAVHPPHLRPHLEVSKDQLVWPNGSVAQFYSAEDPENLRGPQFEIAWCDETSRWRKADYVWTMLQLALRVGVTPQACVTTTPRASAFLKKLVTDPSTVITHAPTAANADNLAPSFLAQMQQRYGGTSIGRQELDGAIVDTHSGGLWRKEWFGQQRLSARPELTRIVVAVDPPITSLSTSDACGIVIAGLGTDKRAYVLADRTIRGREPMIWARAAVAAYHDFAADRIVAEANQGGDLVSTVLRQADANVPVKLVKASRGKWMRAEPVAALYAEGRVAHVGEFVLLEEEMIALGPDGLANGRSPDRLDALVWAITELMLTRTNAPTVRAL